MRSSSWYALYSACFRYLSRTRCSSRRQRSSPPAGSRALRSCLLLKEASKHALRMLRFNKAVLDPNRGQKGEPAFYLIKTFFPFVFYPKKKANLLGGRPGPQVFYLSRACSYPRFRVFGGEEWNEVNFRSRAQGQGKPRRLLGPGPGLWGPRTAPPVRTQGASSRRRAAAAPAYHPSHLRN